MARLNLLPLFIGATLALISIGQGSLGDGCPWGYYLATIQLTVKVVDCAAGEPVPSAKVEIYYDRERCDRGYTNAYGKFSTKFDLCLPEWEDTDDAILELIEEEYLEIRVTKAGYNRPRITRAQVVAVLRSTIAPWRAIVHVDVCMERENQPPMLHSPTHPPNRASGSPLGSMPRLPRTPTGQLQDTAGTSVTGASYLPRAGSLTLKRSTPTMRPVYTESS